MKGVQFVVDDVGKKTAVIISLEEWGELWEDFYDILVSESRLDEPTVSWEELKAEVAVEEQAASNV
jgi:PHD/YefM family antitoxin component YafN of YafNO toxin-antitoxin module